MPIESAYCDKLYQASLQRQPPPKLCRPSKSIPRILPKIHSLLLIFPLDKQRKSAPCAVIGFVPARLRSVLCFPKYRKNGGNSSRARGPFPGHPHYYRAVILEVTRDDDADVADLPDQQQKTNKAPGISKRKSVGLKTSELRNQAATRRQSNRGTTRRTCTHRHRQPSSRPDPFIDCG